VYVGEIYPLPIRSKGIALSTASNYFWKCIITIITPYLMEEHHANIGGRVFYIWGAACLPAAVFAYFCIYETKGWSLEQINRMMEEVPARQSSSWTYRDPFEEPYALDTIRWNVPTYSVSFRNTPVDRPGSGQTDPNTVESVARVDQNERIVTVQGGGTETNPPDRGIDLKFEIRHDVTFHEEQSSPESTDQNYNRSLMQVRQVNSSGKRS
jgi:hypothetical protein